MLDISIDVYVERIGASYSLIKKNNNISGGVFVIGIIIRGCSLISQLTYSSLFINNTLVNIRT